MEPPAWSAPVRPGPAEVARSEALARIEADLAALGRVPHRFAGTDGEREMPYRIRARVPETQKTRVEGFVAFTSPGFVIAAHAIALLVAGVLGLYRPVLASLICALTTASLISEGMGRFSVLRRVLPKSASYNLVWRYAWNDGTPPDARAPGESPPARGTLVITTPMDVPRFQMQRMRGVRRPMQGLVAAAALLTMVLALRAISQPWGWTSVGIYIASLAVLAVASALGIVAHRRSPNTEEASGPAALLELLRRFAAEPPPGLDVWLVFTGCGYAYQNGMHAFLAMRGARLQQPLLVIALSDPGRGGLRVVTREGPLWPVPHLHAGSELVDRLRAKGLDLLSAVSPVSTDARAATLWGQRAIALRGGPFPSTAPDTLRAVEIAQALAFLFAEQARSD